MPARRFVVAAILLLASGAFAQVRIDDLPKPIDDGRPLTKEELDRRKADQLLRDARTQFGLAIVHQRHDKLIEAVNTLEKAAHLDPDSLEVRRALIPLYVALGRDDAALALCKQIVDRDPFDLDAAFQYARLVRADGHPADAVPALKKAADGKNAIERPERLLYVLAELSDLLDKQGDFAGVAKAQDGIVKTITSKREQLLYGNGFTREDLQANLARSYEALGRACVKTKEYDRAVTAFRSARDLLIKCEDPEARHAAVRINWNLSDLATARGRYAEALEALDAYLEHGPVETEPYEKKIELLKKLGREKDIVPALRRYAAHEEFNLGLQLLLARELAQDQRTRPEAEKMYTALVAKNVKPEVYRGLFRLYKADDRMGKVIDRYDEAVRVFDKKENEIAATEREAAAEQVRAMLAALRVDRELVAALLPEALAELGRGQKRTMDTWVFLANVAARARQLDKAEQFFRQCLASGGAAEHAASVYVGLTRVLYLQHKHADTVAICRDGLARRGSDLGIQMVLEPAYAQALAALGNFDEALAHAEKAIKVTSDNFQVQERCRKAHILAQAGRYEAAVSECEETLKKFTAGKQVREVRYTLSNVFSIQGDHEKSEEQLRLILDVSPEEPLANNNLGYQMADRKVNLDEAERLIRRAVEVDRLIRKDVDEDGENASYLDSLGWVLFRKGKLDEAREWLEKAVALPDGADHAEIWDHLGDVLAKLEQPARAREAWQTALKLYATEAGSKSDGRRAEVEKKLKTLE
jgi:tetratricopeptide (TPR) repeat protein